MRKKCPSSAKNSPKKPLKCEKMSIRNERKLIEINKETKDTMKRNGWERNEQKKGKNKIKKCQKCP